MNPLYFPVVLPFVTKSMQQTPTPQGCYRGMRDLTLHRKGFYKRVKVTTAPPKGCGGLKPGTRRLIAPRKGARDPKLSAHGRKDSPQPTKVEHANQPSAEGPTTHRNQTKVERAPGLLHYIRTQVCVPRRCTNSFITRHNNSRFHELTAQPAARESIHQPHPTIKRARRRTISAASLVIDRHFLKGVTGANQSSNQRAS